MFTSNGIEQKPFRPRPGTNHASESSMRHRIGRSRKINDMEGIPLARVGEHSGKIRGSVVGGRSALAAGGRPNFVTTNGAIDRRLDAPAKVSLADVYQAAPKPSILRPRSSHRSLAARSRA